MYGDFPAKNTVCTPYIYGSGQPYTIITISQSSGNAQCMGFGALCARTQVLCADVKTRQLRQCYQSSIQDQVQRSYGPSTNWRQGAQKARTIVESLSTKKARCTSLRQKKNLSPPERQGAPLFTKKARCTSLHQKRRGAPLSTKRKTSLHQKGKVRLSSPKRQGAPLSTKKGKVHLSPPKEKPLSTKKARCASLHQKGKVHLSPPKKARCTSLHQKENLSPPKRQGAPLSTKEGKVHNRTHTHTHTHHSGNFGWKHTQAETH